MWLVFALLSAFSAAMVAILGKIGIQELDSTLATTIRAIIMALFLIVVSFSLGKFKAFSLNSLQNNEWIYIVLAGIAGALSWLFYFFALKIGKATPVVAIDRLSMVIVVVLATLFLGETLSWQVVLGAVLMVGGAMLISFN